LPAKLRPLLPAAFAAVFLAGCTSASLDGGLEAGAGYSFDGGTSADLPESMAVPANSFAAPPVSEGTVMAALAGPGDGGPRVPDGLPDPQRAALDRLIAKYAALYEVPEGLVRRVVRRESNFRPEAHSKGNWGLMQIRHATARGMGYDGPADGLLDAETNLKYAVKYLRGAWLVAQGSADRAVRFYASGYYYDAKRMGLLDETGLGRDRARRRI